MQVHTTYADSACYHLYAQVGITEIFVHNCHNTLHQTVIGRADLEFFDIPGLRLSAHKLVFESCPTKILLANPDAKGSKIGEFYRDFLQLNERQVNLIAHMARKREYYIISPKGRRLFSLGLGPVALSFVGASGSEDLARVRELKEKYGRDWPVQWLRERELSDWADGWLKLDRSDEFTSWREKRRLNNNEKISKVS